MPLGEVMSGNSAPVPASVLSPQERRHWVETKAQLAWARRELWTAYLAILYRKARYYAVFAKVPVWVAALSLGSLVAIVFSFSLILLSLSSSLLLLIFCLIGYGVGGGLGFLIFRDEPGEDETSRLVFRRKRVAIEDEKRRAIDLKVLGLKAELSLQNQVIQAVMEAARSRVFAAAEEAKRAAEAQAAAAIASAEGARRLAEDRAHAAMVELAAAREELDAMQGAVDQATSRLLAVEPGRLYPHELEAFVAQIFSHIGYTVQHTGQTGDQGVDVLAEKLGFRLAIQVKCYSNSVGNSAVQRGFRRDDALPMQPVFGVHE